MLTNFKIHYQRFHLLLPKHKKLSFLVVVIFISIILYFVVFYGNVDDLFWGEQRGSIKDNVNTGGSDMSGVQLPPKDDQKIRLRRLLPITNSIFRLEYDFEHFTFVIYSSIPEEIVSIQLQQWLMANNFSDLNADEFIYVSSDD